MYFGDKIASSGLKNTGSSSSECRTDWLHDLLDPRPPEMHWSQALEAGHDDRYRRGRPSQKTSHFLVSLPPPKRLRRGCSLMLCSLSREGRTCSYTTQTHCPVLSWLHSKMKEIARVRETVFLLLLVPNGPSEYRLGEHPLLKRLHAQAIWSWSPKHLWKRRRTEIQGNTSKYLGHSRFVPEAPVYLFFFFSPFGRGTGS